MPSHEHQALLQHAAFLRNVARAVLWGDDQIDDVVQETFVTAMEKDRTRTGPLRPWLAGIARRKAFALRRLRHAYRARERRASRPEAVPSVHDTLVRAETSRRVVDAVLALPDPYRTALLLRYYDDLPPRHAAARLGVPVETVRTQTKRGLEKLRQQLAQSTEKRDPNWLAALLLFAPAELEKGSTGLAPAATTIGALLLSKHVLAVATVLILCGTAAFFVSWTPSSLPSRPDSQQSERSVSNPTLAAAGNRVAASPEARNEAGFVTIGGTAIGPDMAPLARVKLAAKAHPGLDASMPPKVQAEIQTDHEGRFGWRLMKTDLPLYVVVQAVGADGTDARDAAKVLPDAPPPTSLRIFIFPRDTYVVGRIMDEAGTPIAEGEVFAGAYQPGTPCDANGNYRVHVSGASGRVNLAAAAHGYALARGTAAVATGASETRLDFRLRREFAVSGLVTDPDGRAIEGAIVKTFNTMYYNEARTDAHGRYRLGRLDPAQPKHSLFARFAGFTEARADVSAASAMEDVILRLGRGVPVTGVVTDAGGRPLMGADLFLGFSESYYGRLDAVSGADGSFLFAAVSPGPHCLVAQRAGHRPFMMAIDVPQQADQPFAVRVVMTAGRQLKGRVIDPAGTPVAGAFCSIRHRGMYVQSRGVTDTEGRFSIQDVPRDEVQIEIYRGGYVSTNAPVPAGRDDELEFTLEAAAGLAGRVLDDQTGRPISAFLVRLAQPNLAEGEKEGLGYAATWSVGHRFSRADGTWDTAATRLRSGEVFDVEVVAEGYAPAVNSHVVATSNPSADALVMRLRRGAALQGAVVSSDADSPVEAASVFLYDAEDPRWLSGSDGPQGRALTRSDARGAFRFDGVAPGLLYLAVVHPDHPPLFTGPHAVGEVSVDLGRLRLVAGAVLEGLVADADGGPLGGARLEVRGAGPLRAEPGTFESYAAPFFGRTWEATADADGRFRVAGLPAGRLLVAYVTQDQYASTIQRYAVELDLAAGERSALSLAPDGSATIRGRVVSEVELPALLTASLRPASPGSGADLPIRTVDVRDGRFSFPRVRPGDYSLDVSWRQLPAGGGRMALPNVKRQPLTIAEREAKAIEVRIEYRVR